MPHKPMETCQSKIQTEWPLAWLEKIQAPPVPMNRQAEYQYPYRSAHCHKKVETVAYKKSRPFA